MEARVHISSRIISWLASMGYPVAGMPGEILHRMLLHEARQWQLSPESLAEMIDEGAGHDGVHFHASSPSHDIRRRPSGLRSLPRHFADQGARPAETEAYFRRPQ